MLLNSEKTEELKKGIIMLTTMMKRPLEIYVSVDNSPGFRSLLQSNNNDLSQMQIKIVKTDELNKNANAVIDKGCQELENELKRLDPKGQPISVAVLNRAIINLNSKLRRRGNISAWEINSARDQNSGENLHLDDRTIRKNQITERHDNRRTRRIQRR